jgi:hypothetical protein
MSILHRAPHTSLTQNTTFQKEVHPHTSTLSFAPDAAYCSGGDPIFPLQGSRVPKPCANQPSSSPRLTALWVFTRCVSPLGAPSISLPLSTLQNETDLTLMRPSGATNVG